MPTVREPELSIVIPVFNEEDNLAPLWEEIRATLDPLGIEYEALFIDDGSTDRSPRVLAALAARDPRMRIVRQQRNAGQSAAFAAGFQLARAPIVATLDADLQNDPADIPRLLRALDESDVVCGIRANRHDSLVRRISSRIANGVRNRLTHDDIVDTGCSLKVFRAPFLRHLPMFTGMHRFLPTLLRLQGARVKQIPVNHRPRRFGSAKYGIGNRVFRALADLFAVRWMQRRWIDRGLTEEVTPAGGPKQP